VKHVFCRLFEIVVARELRKRNFFREKINFENIMLMEGVLEVALPASVMLKGRSNVPSDLSMCTKWGTGIRGCMGHNLGAHGCKWCPIEVKLIK
jgi:hypothetical protein